MADAADAALALPTRTPIKHQIVVVGESVTFDTRAAATSTRGVSRCSISLATGRSRDRLANPVMDDASYLPENSPAIGNLMSLFNFGDR